jgi:hypothetical protein
LLRGLPRRKLSFYIRIQKKREQSLVVLSMMQARRR